MGWGIAVMPEQMAAPGLAAGTLQPLHAQVHVDVLLHWHQWKLLSGPAPAQLSAADTPLRAGVLDRIGRALADGARSALRPPPG